MDTFTEHFYGLSLDGTCDEYDFGSDGYVDHYTVVAIEPEDRIRFPRDIGEFDKVVIVHVDNQGFKDVTARPDADDLEAEYDAFCESMEDVDA